MTRYTPLSRTEASPTHPWTGNIGQRRPLRHDGRPLPQRRNRPHNHTIHNFNATPQLGNLDVLLWHARRPLSPHLLPPTLQHRPRPRRRRHLVGSCGHAYRDRDFLAGSLRSTLFSRLCGKHHPYRFHVYRQWVLHPERAESETELVVFFHGRVDDHWRRLELRVCAN